MYVLLFLCTVVFFPFGVARGSFLFYVYCSKIDSCRMKSINEINKTVGEKTALSSPKIQHKDKRRIVYNLCKKVTTIFEHSKG